jgi:hypothetical protein
MLLDKLLDKENIKMAQLNIHLKGWHAALAVIVIIGLVIFRFISFQDKTDDKNLMKLIETHIVSDYFPEEVARLQTSVDSGDTDLMAQTVKSVTDARPVIESVKISAPLLSFSSSKDVEVKVVYSLSEGPGTRDRKTVYYLVRHGVIGNTWQHRYESNALSYYLNFR